MPVIEIRRTIAAPIEKIVEIAQDVEAYPEFMPDVKSVKVQERSEDGRTQVSEWVGIIKQFSREVKWTQKDTWNADKTRVDFHQVKGDYDKMEGYWEFKSTDGGTEFLNVLDYEYNVPLLGKLVTKVVEFLVRQNLVSMTDAIERKVKS